MPGKLDDRGDSRRSRLAQQTNGVANVLRPPERRRRLQQDDDLRQPSGARQGLHGVHQHRRHWRVVGRQRCRAHERHLEARLTPDIGNLVGIGRQDDAVEHPGFLRHPRRVGEQRLAGQ